MSNYLRVGLVVGLSLSSSWLLGCNDDDDDNTTSPDASTDAGTKVDGSIDASTPGIDASVPDTGAPDAAARVDASVGTAITYNVTLTKAEEVPVCAGAGSAANATATVVVSADNSKIDLTLSYSGLSGAPALPAAGHFHAGALGASGPVVLPFGGTLESPIVRTLTAANYVAATGAPANFPEFIETLKQGRAYLNLHTAACAPGEIRGQID